MRPSYQTAARSEFKGGKNPPNISKKDEINVMQPLRTELLSLSLMLKMMATGALKHARRALQLYFAEPCPNLRHRK
jgi:hypothetical protein